MIADLHKRLRNCKSFSNLNDDELKEIIQNSSIYDFNRQRTLYYQGDKANTVYLVLKGRIDKIKYRSDYSSIKIGTLQEDDWTGIPEVLANASYLSDAITYVNSKLLSISRNNFIKLLEIKKFENYILRYVSKSFFSLHSQLEHYTPLQKIIEFLKLNIDSADSSNAKTKNIVIDITQDNLSDFLGFTRETINRNLKVLEKKGVISISRGKIEINNAEELEKSL